MNCPIPNGLLVAIEGIDGAGKTSIATVIAQWCGEHGLGAMISKEPTSLRWGAELRRSAREGRLSAERELELFILDRQEHVAKSVQPALDENNIAVLDRYYFSTAAYQGARGLDVEGILEQNEAFAPIPDITIILDVNASTGLERIRARGDAPNVFELESSLSRARAIFLEIAAARPKAVKVIDASAPFREVADEALCHFKTAAMHKIALAGPLQPHMVDATLVFFGEAPIGAESDQAVREACS